MTTKNAAALLRAAKKAKEIADLVEKAESLRFQKWTAGRCTKMAIILQKLSVIGMGLQDSEHRVATFFELNIEDMRTAARNYIDGLGTGWREGV